MTGSCSRLVALVLAVVMGGSFAALAAQQPRLEVVGATPQGALSGDEPRRIQVVFSAPVVALGEVRPMAEPPSWLVVEPPVLARWRWAGTAELVGEPIGPLPRATGYRVTVTSALRSPTGAGLAAPYAFSFTTALPEVEIRRDDDATLGEEWEGEESHRYVAASDRFTVRLEFNQPVDPASVQEKLAVRVAPRPVPDAGALVTPEQVESWRNADPAALAGWERFQAAAKGAVAGDAVYTLEPSRERPLQVFFVRPVGCWPTAAALTVEVRPGVRSLEGRETRTESTAETFDTPWPFAPLRLEGRTIASQAGFDPDGLSLRLSADATWQELAPHLTWRIVGAEPSHHVPQLPEEWFWDEPDTRLRLGFLGLPGARDVEVCLDASAADAQGREVGFPWCGTVRTAHRAPAFYLVEGDGVVEWQGPHLLPLKSVNVLSYRLAQRRLGEDELVGLLARGGNVRSDAPAPAGEVVRVATAPDRGGVTPVDLEPVLAGKPGLVLSELRVEDVLPDSEYNEDQQRWLRQPRRCITQVTSLGLTVKASGHEGVLAWVTRLADAAPVAGAVVEVRDRDNETLWRGTTDASGLVASSALTAGSRPFVVLARVGDDVAYTRASWYEGHSGWEFNLPVDYDLAPPMVGRVFSDRGVVRPGESLHVKAVLRRQEERHLRIPTGEVKLAVRDSRDETVLERVVKLDAFGCVETEVQIPSHAALGSWVATVAPVELPENPPPGSAWDVSGDFRVAEFRRPKFRVAVTASRSRLVAGDALAARVEGKLLAGGAMGGAPTRWAVRATRDLWRPDATRWRDYEMLPVAFVDPWEDTPTTTVAEGRGALDAAGQLEIGVPRAEAEGGFPVKLEVEGTVEDLDRQVSSSTATLQVLPGEVFLALKRPGTLIEAARGVGTAVAAVRPDGAAVSGVAVHAELVRRHWESVRRREVSGRYVFESRSIRTTVASQDLTTASEPVALHFDLPEGGEYGVVLTSRDGRGNLVTASTDFYVLGAGFTPWRLDQENRIELVPERESFAPGETARVLVKSPWEQTLALVTVERAGVMESRVERLAGTMPVLTVPIRLEHTPNVYVSVVLLRGRMEAAAEPEMIDPGRPAYRIGMCELKVPPKGRKLVVTVAPAKPEYRPGQTATVEVAVVSETGAPRPAGVTVWAVDAGVLELTAYRTPDLMSTFYARRGLGVSTAESRSRLVGRRSYGTKGDKSGGGGGMEAVGSAVRRDFRALAVWQGDVVTDSSGRATVRFQLPDSLTTYRIMAVALAGAEEFGSADVELQVSKPLGLEPALPRFLRPEDKARAGVLVRNRTQGAREVEVTLELPAGGPLRLRGTATRVAMVPAGGSAEVGFGLVGVEPGTAKLRFVASSPHPTPETDAFEIDLPVVAMAPGEHVATFFETSQRHEEVIAVPAEVFPAVGGLEVRLASTDLVGIDPGVRFLAEYRHACAEQVASQVLGLGAAARIDAALTPGQVGELPREKWLQQAVGKLLACQRGDGGFAFWPEGWASVPELSAHVVRALAAARAAGVAVEQGALDRAAEYLSGMLRREEWPGGAAHGWTARALASLALGALGKAEPPYHQTLLDQRAGTPLWARALLVRAIAEQARDDRRLAPVLQEIRNALVLEARVARLQEHDPEWGFLVWSSEARGSATALLALMAAAPTDPAVDRLARGVVEHLARDRHLDTHETSWMLEALAAYAAGRETSGRRTVTAELGGERLLKAELGGQVTTTRAQVGMTELQQRATHAAARNLPLVVEASGGLVHGAATLAYASRRADRPPVSQGLTLSRRILDARGQPMAALVAGDEVTVEVTVEATATLRWLAVEVPLPAGLEAVDPGLATTARRVENEGFEEEGEVADLFWWRPGFDHVELRDDRIVLYATELAPGTARHMVRCRATIPGSFLLAPSRAEQMYAPEVFGTTPVAALEIAVRK